MKLEPKIVIVLTSTHLKVLNVITQMKSELF